MVFFGLTDYLEKGREKEIVLFHLFLYSLVDSRMYSDQASNPQPWSIG